MKTTKKPISIVKHTPPKIKRPKFKCDLPLDPKLDAHPITALMNKASNSVAIIGKPGSGKSNLIISMLQSKSLFKGCYDKIVVCMPQSSIASIQGTIFQDIPEGQIYDHVDLAVLQEIEAFAKGNWKNGLLTLVLFDDVQKFLRANKATERMLLNLMNNRRHMGLTMWFAAQNYKSSFSPAMRDVLGDLFIFKLSKQEITKVFDDLIDVNRNTFDQLQDNVLFKEPHSFLYINLLTRKMFSNWTDEIVLDEGSEDEQA